jgi:hypothetical protein
MRVDDRPGRRLGDQHSALEQLAVALQAKLALVPVLRPGRRVGLLVGCSRPAFAAAMCVLLGLPSAAGFARSAARLERLDRLLLPAAGADLGRLRQGGGAVAAVAACELGGDERLQLAVDGLADEFAQFGAALLDRCGSALLERSRRGLGHGRKCTSGPARGKTAAAKIAAMDTNGSLASWLSAAILKP